jgi:hypothetical protein
MESGAGAGRSFGAQKEVGRGVGSWEREERREA